MVVGSHRIKDRAGSASEKQLPVALFGPGRSPLGSRLVLGVIVSCMAAVQLTNTFMSPLKALIHVTNMLSIP